MTIANKQEFSRRTFVKGSALAGLGAAICSQPLFAFADEPAEKVDEAAETPAQTNEKVVWSHCSVNCETRCALRLHVVDDEVVWVETDNTGNDIYDECDHQLRACQRGRSIRRWINHPDRLQYPMKRVGKRGEGKFEQITWDEATTLIAENYQRILEEYGPEAIWNHYASGVCANNIGGFLSRLINMNGGSLGRYGSYSSAHISAALPYLYGSRDANANSDVVNAKLVVLFGDNSSETKMAGAGPTYHYSQGIEKGGAKVIVIDPRYSDTTAALADEWIPIRPGTDAALVDALAYVMITEDLVDADFLATYTIGYDEDSMPEEAKGQNKSYKSYILGEGEDGTPKTPEWAEAITLVPRDRIESLAREIAEAKPCAIYQGKGPQRQSNGEQTARAICMLPVLTGNVGIHGGNSGSDLNSSYISMGGVPSGDNGVETSIATFEWIEAVDHGTELTRTRNGVRGKEKLDVPIKFIWNYAGNTITNQHSDINYTNEVLQDETKCEFIVVWDTFLTDSAKYADVLLPDLMPAEQPTVVTSEYAGNMPYGIMSDACTSPKFERRTLYASLTDIADKLGQKDEFTEGKNEMQWLQSMYEEAREGNADLPEFDAMMEQGLYKMPEFDEHHVAFKDFREDPEANPLNTPSGKIEIYSQKLVDDTADWELAEGEYIHALPVYCEGVEGYQDANEQYPLQMIGFHYKGRAHSSYGCIEVLKQANPQELWMNPVDAEARALADGDMVHVFNDRGTVEIPVKVTPRIIPGVCAMPQGAWHDADMAGDKIDKGGCINTLTAYRPSPLAKANPQHTNLVQVEKA